MNTIQWKRDGKNHGRHYVVSSDVFVKSNEAAAEARTLVSAAKISKKIINHCTVVVGNISQRVFFLKLN